MMKRRDFIAGGCAVPIALGVGTAVAKPLTMEITVADAIQVKQLIEDLYWEKQWLIGEYEQELQDMRNHGMVREYHRKYSEFS